MLDEDSHSTQGTTNHRNNVETIQESVQLEAKEVPDKRMILVKRITR